MEPTSHRPRRTPASTVRLTERDRRLLTFAAEHRFVLPAQVAVLLDVTGAAADARLRALAHGGYVERSRPLLRHPPFDQITRSGLRAAGSDLPLPRAIDLSTYRHDRALGWLMLAAQRGRFGALEQIASERRMRSEDGRRPDGERARHGVRLGGVGPAGRDRLHYPDLVLVTASGHRVAVELELTTKTSRRREEILAGYGADRRIDAVVYLVETAAAGRAIERSAARVGIRDLVRVKRVRLADTRPAPGAGLSAARRHERAAGRVGEASR